MLMALRSDSTQSRHRFLVPWKGRVFCNLQTEAAQAAYHHLYDQGDQANEDASP